MHKDVAVFLDCSCSESCIAVTYRSHSNIASLNQVELRGSPLLLVSEASRRDEQSIHTGALIAPSVYRPHQFASARYTRLPASLSGAIETDDDPTLTNTPSLSLAQGCLEPVEGTENSTATGNVSTA